MLVEPPPPPKELKALVDNISFNFGDCGGGGLDVDEMEEDVLIRFKSQMSKVTEQIWQATVRVKTKEQLGKHFVRLEMFMLIGTPCLLLLGTPSQ